MNGIERCLPPLTSEWGQRERKPTKRDKCYEENKQGAEVDKGLQSLTLKSLSHDIRGEILAWQRPCVPWQGDLPLTEESSKDFKRRNYRLWFMFEDSPSRCHVDNGLGWGEVSRRWEAQISQGHVHSTRPRE